MRQPLLTLTLLFASLGSQAEPSAEEGILEVLARSQQARLERQPAADPSSPRAQTVRASFDKLAASMPMEPAVELRLISGDTVAETLQGHVILANESLADLSEGERLFILAHEFGHVALRHWPQTERLYLKWVPGAVTPEQTDPVAGSLGRDASGLAHAQEFEADQFALRKLQALGFSGHDAVTTFLHMGSNQDTPTHPATSKRVAALRDAGDASRVPAAPPALVSSEPAAGFRPRPGTP